MAKVKKKSGSKKDSTKPASTKVVTGLARSSYMKVLKLVEDDNGNRKCGTSILIPKSDKKTVKKIKAAINLAAKKKLGDKTKIFESQKLKNPLKDGDVLAADPETSNGKESEGHYIISTTSYKVPQVVDKHNERITDPDELESICVSGFYFHFSIEFRGFEVDVEGGGKSRGVRCLLNNLMFVKEGERFDGGTDAEEDFEGIEYEADDDDDDWDDEDDD